MRTKRRVRIRVESESVLVLRGARGLVSAYCASCNRDADFVPLEEICASPLFDAESLRRLDEDGRIHVVETERGARVVCLRSALKLLGEQGTT